MFLGACSAPQDRQREQMMDQIEKQVRLPQGAEPLDKYVRYYAGLGPRQHCRDLHTARAWRTAARRGLRRTQSEY